MTRPFSALITIALLAAGPALAHVPAKGERADDLAVDLMKEPAAASESLPAGSWQTEVTSAPVFEGDDTAGKTPDATLPAHGADGSATLAPDANEVTDRVQGQPVTPAQQAVQGGNATPEGRGGANTNPRS
ncbi:MAG: hypothetical protein JJU19_07510 [Pararhodobacter sp.]|nr:hypothetical protein [Pararhodobacter sp.]